MRERLINRRRQGDLGEASAIEWLTAKGALVWIPLGHSPDVDLIAEVDGRPLRIQVKTCASRSFTPDGNERWNVQLATNGGNQSWSGRTKQFDPRHADFVFAVVGDGRRWLVPASSLECSVRVGLGGRKYSEFEVERGNPIESLVYSQAKGRTTIGARQGECQSGQMDQTVNLTAYAFAGSNPASPTERSARPMFERKLGRAGQAIVRGKRQMTIPARPYTEAGLNVGDRVRFRADGRGRIVLERITAPSNTLGFDDGPGSESTECGPTDPG